MVRADYIGGSWVEGSAAVLDVNPSDLADVVGEYAVGDEAQVDDAIGAATTAAPAWAASTPAERFGVLERVGLSPRGSGGRAGEQLSREEGKPRPEGVGEVLRAAQLFRFFAGEALRVPGEHVRSVRPGVDVDVLREPLGVVGIITPWNFPIAIPAWKIAPALAFGCTVVFKPAELVPASAWSLVEACVDAGLPPGVLNLVVGPGRVVGERCCTTRGCVGSRSPDRRRWGRGSPRRWPLDSATQLEMGGKNPLVVLDDADLDIAVNCAVQGAFFQTGQRCTASSRLIVTRGSTIAFVNSVAARMRALRVGHALAEGTEIGPVMNEDQLGQDLAYLAIGRTRAPSSCSEAIGSSATPTGYYLEPALFVGTSNDMRVNREEIFGPIATVVRARCRRGPRARERHRVRPVGRGVHDVARACGPLPGRAAGGHRDREPAHRRRGLPRAVRRHEGSRAAAGSKAGTRSSSSRP